MKKSKNFKIFFSLFVVIVMLFSLTIQRSYGGDTPVPKGLQIAPVNPTYINSKANPPAVNYGYIPPPVDLSHLKGATTKNYTATALPTQFDWRGTGVTSVKNQATCGTCWTFGTNSVLESKVLINEGNVYDFSEQSVALSVDRSWVYLYDNSDDPCNAGGNSILASEVFIRKGAVLESCSPYNCTALQCDGSCVGDDCPGIKRVNGYRIVTDDGTQTDLIKQAIYDKGPVTMSFYYDSSYLFNDPTYGYIYDCNLCSSSNHLVSIVGWDDNIPHYNTSGTGAWIVKNSWGTSWGNSGYFYLAYNSSCMCGISYLKYEDYNPNKDLYLWDEAGWTTMLGYSDTYAWMASVYTAEEAGNLANVEFWVPGASATYDLYVYDGYFGSTLLSHEVGSLNEAGYYSVPLFSPVNLSYGEQFTIEIKLTTPGYNYPIPVECVNAGSYEPSIQTNVTFAKHNDGDSWWDTSNSGWNVCLRAVVDSSVTPEQDQWVPINNGLYGGSTPSLAIDPTNTQVIYAGTVEDGVFKSTNGGTSWTKMSNGVILNEVMSLAIDPTNTQVIYAGTWQGAFKSADGGTSWTQINNGLPTSGVRSLAIDHTSTQIIYAGTGVDGVFKSTDGGALWTQINNGLYGGRVSSLAIDPTNTQVIYAGTWSDGIFKSTDGGASWTQMSNGLANTDVMSLAIDPTNTQVIYAGTWSSGFLSGGAFKSTDGGASWTQIITMGFIYANTSVRSLAIDHTNTQIIYAGTAWEGVYKSINGGASWTLIGDGLPYEASVPSLAIDPTNTQVVYAGMHNSVVFKSTNGGTSWTQINNGRTSTFISSLAIDLTNTQVIYAGTWYSGVFKSTNGGALWTQINNGLYGIRVSSLAIDPTNTQIVYAGTWSGGVFKSTNGGTSWTQINNGLTEEMVAYSLAIDPTNTQVIYAGTLYDGIFKSTDGGASWTQINNGLTETTAYSLAIDPTNTQIVYAGTCGYVFKSTDGGTLWARMPNGLINKAISSLAIDPTNTQVIYAGTYTSGVYKSTDGGALWTQMIDGLTDLSVRSLAIDPTNVNMIYAGTDRGGIFRYICSSPPPTVTLTYPNGGETLTANTPINVTWTISGDTSLIHHISVDYTTDNGATWHCGFGVFSNFSSSMSKSWTVPIANSTQCKLRIGLVRTDATVSVDYSDSVFTIAGLLAVTLTQPNGGESWQAGSTQNVTWTVSYTPTEGTFSIWAYSPTIGWYNLGEVPYSSTSFSWNVNVSPSDDWMVRVWYIDGSNNWIAYDDSDNAFTVTAPSVTVTPTVTSPNGGESWQAGSTQNVTWTVSYTPTEGTFSIWAYSPTIGWYNLGEVPYSSTSFSWNVNVSPSDDWMVRVWYIDGSNNWIAYDDSDNVFTVAP